MTVLPTGLIPTCITSLSTHWPKQTSSTLATISLCFSAVKLPCLLCHNEPGSRKQCWPLSLGVPASMVQEQGSLLASPGCSCFPGSRWLFSIAHSLLPVFCPGTGLEKEVLGDLTALTSLVATRLSLLRWSTLMPAPFVGNGVAPGLICSWLI